MSELLLIPGITAPVAPVTGPIVFGTSGIAHSNTGAFSIPEGDIAIVLACSNVFDGTNYPTPSLPVSNKWTSLYASVPSNAIGGVRLGYQIAPVGGISGTEIWTNADYIGWWTASNPLKTWILGTLGVYFPTAQTVTMTYPSCAPNGVDDWVVMFGDCAGGFAIPDLTNGTPIPVKRSEVTGSGSGLMKIFDTGAVALTVPGQTSSPGYTSWAGFSQPLRPGATLLNLLDESSVILQAEDNIDIQED